jgi:hypothetical protein
MSPIEMIGGSTADHGGIVCTVLEGREKYPQIVMGGSGL